VVRDIREPPGADKSRLEEKLEESAGRASVSEMDCREGARALT